MKQISTTINMTRLAIAQGIYYLITGIWPLIDMYSFIAVTGPKTDLWLVRTVAMLIFFIGGGILAAGIRRQINLPIIIIAAGSAFGLILVDVSYVWLGIISLVYLLDAVAETLIFILWIVLILKKDKGDVFSSSSPIEE
ncbi:MAG: hypothetical protein WD016_10895 [Balneolaceae bacterium]